jgi:hypothetical protein
MNKINQFKIQLTCFSQFFVYYCRFFVFNSCSNDYKQTVATFNNLVIADEFSVNGAPNSKMWGYDIGTGSNLG